MRRGPRAYFDGTPEKWENSGHMSQGRKADHLRICAEMDVEFRQQSTWLEHVQLVHAALADISCDKISTDTSFMGRPLRAPLMITAISG